jgi:hypothetical protein
VAQSMLYEIQKQQPKDMNCLGTQILAKHKEDKIISHFQSTLRHPFVFSTFPTRDKYEEDQVFQFCSLFIVLQLCARNGNNDFASRN